MKRLTIILTIILTLIILTLFLAGCGAKKEAPKTVEQQKPQQETIKLKIGLKPSNNPTEMMEHYRPLIRHLENSLNADIEPFVTPDYNIMIDSMQGGKVDLAFFGPFSYVLASEKAGAEAFAVEIPTGGSKAAKSIIVTHRDSGIKNVADLKDKTFAFVDTNSVTGNLIPRVMLKKKGMDPERQFGGIVYAGKAESVGQNVKNKRIDAGAMDNLTYQAMLDKGLINKDEIVILWESDPLPGPAIAFGSNLPGDLKEKLKQAFLSMPKGHLGEALKISHYESASDSDYQVVRETAREFNINPAQIESSR